jgi:hypothetical protein
MKKLMVGVGLTVLAVPSAQAWTGVEDWGTMTAQTRAANLAQPIVRVVKRYQTATLAVVPYQPSHATGWQRSARVHPQRWHSSQRKDMGHPRQNVSAPNQRDKARHC